MNKRTSYNQILKAASILGSSQFINIVLRLVRTKLVALMLGPIGIGLIGTFQAAIDAVSSFCRLGLDAGAVREISQVKAHSKRWKVERAIYIFRRWFFISACLGALVCITSAYPIGRYFFKNSEHTTSIALIAICVFFTILSSGRTSILQGLRKVPYLAKATIIESIINLVLSLAIYYHFGQAGIIAVMITNSIVLFICLNYFYFRLKIKDRPTTTYRTINTGVRALRLGIYLTIGACVSALSMIVVRFIIHYFSEGDSKDTIGLFQSAWTVSAVFASFVITAIGTDFFARLCSVNKNNKKVNELVNEQTYIVACISTPAIILILLFAYYILDILYSEQFGLAQNMLHWQIAGVFLKLLATPIASILIAKNRGIVYLISETIYFVTYLASCYLLAPTYGLNGIGISYLVAYAVYLVIVMALSYGVASTIWNKENWILILNNILLVSGAFYIAFLQSEYILSFGLIILTISISYSIYRLSKVFSWQQFRDSFGKNE